MLARLGPMSLECTKASHHKAMERLKFRESQWRAFENALEFDWADEVLNILYGAQKISVQEFLAQLEPNAAGDDLKLLRSCIRDIQKSCSTVGFTKDALIRYCNWCGRAWYEAGPLLEEYRLIGEWWTVEAAYQDAQDRKRAAAATGRGGGFSVPQNG